MERKQVTCGNCGGLGTTTIWEMVSDNKLEAKKITCKQCNGKGYTEYAIFSVEEAEAILKHCGLSTEN